MDILSQKPKFFKDKRILTLLAHPDDECLGCGGTLVRAKREGAVLSCVIPVKRLQKECSESMGKLGVDLLSFGDFEDQMLDHYPLLDLCKFFSKEVDSFSPDIVILHHPTCTNQDHRRCYEAGIIANRFNDAMILTCEIPSSTGYLKPNTFDPNMYVDITVTDFVQKMYAFEKYTTELKKYPHPRSIEKLRCLAEYRGSQINTKYAESFMVMRNVI